MGVACSGPCYMPLLETSVEVGLDAVAEFGADAVAADDDVDFVCCAVGKLEEDLSVVVGVKGVSVVTRF